MATYTFPGQPVIASDDILENATGGIFVDDADNVIPIYDVNDLPLGTITSNAFGLSAVFKADVPSGYVKFGSVKNFVTCKEIVQFALNAQSAIATANAANAAAQSALSQVQAFVATYSNSGSIPPGTNLDAIVDSSTRLAMTPAERSKLGSTPTTFLTLGTSATQAMPGNKTFTAIDVAAVATVNGAQRQWKPRPASQGYPTAAEGAQEGDIADLYQDS
jgi:hypothetical protein